MWYFYPRVSRVVKRKQKDRFVGGQYTGHVSHEIEIECNPKTIPRIFSKKKINLSPIFLSRWIINKMENLEKGKNGGGVNGN